MFTFKANLILGFAMFCLPFSIVAQSKKDLKKQEKREHAAMLDSLQSRIQLAKFAELTKMPSQEEVLQKGSNFPYSEYILGIRDFLKNYLKLKIIATKDELEKLTVSSDETDIVSVNAEIGEFNEKIGAVGNYSFYFALKFQDGKEFSFKTKIGVIGITNFRTVIYNTCQFHFPIEIKKK